MDPIKRIHQYCDKHGFILQHSTIQMIRKSFTKMMTSAFDYGIEQKNLKEKNIDIKLQLTHVNALPSRTEQGIFLIIELGNLLEDVRYSLVSLLGKQIPSYEILHSKGYNLPENIRKSKGTVLLDHLTMGLKDFLKQIPFNTKTSHSFQLGLLLHFPIKQNDFHHTEILSWSDRFNCPDLLHQDFIRLFQRSIEYDISNYQINIIACIQESVAALISVAFEYPNTLISLIFKHTFQLSFVEDTENLRPTNIHQQVQLRALYRTILSVNVHCLHSNTSSQNHALFQTLLTSIDRYILKELNVNYFDVLTCDSCLLEIIRILILELCLHEQLLPYSLWSQSKLNYSGSLCLNFLSYLLQGKYTKLKPYLNTLGLKQLKQKNLIHLEYICHIIIRRSTQILSCLIVCLSERYNEENLTIAIDSYLYRLCPIYQIYMHNEIEYLCKRWITMFHFVNATNISYLGPAVVMGLQKTQKAMINQDDDISRLFKTIISNTTDRMNTSQSLTNNFRTNTPLLFSFLFLFAYGIIFLIGLIANIFVIIVIIKCRRMRTLTNRFLLNLAISDLIATLICLPPTAYHHYEKRWIFGELLCRFVPFIQGTSVAVSIFTLMAVSIDRFLAIHKPIHSKLFCTPSRVFIIIGLIWFVSFLLMIPLIVHHRIIDPFDITLTACAEEWQQNMNARLVYDFLLLFVLFILPLTLMAYCYVRISFSLWFIDSQARTSSSSTTNAARYSTISEDFPQVDINDIRRQSSQKNRPYYIHYHKKYENDLLRKQINKPNDEYHSLMNTSGSKLPSHRPPRSTTMDDMKPKSCSIGTPTTMNTSGPHTFCRRSSSLIGRRFGENGFTHHHHHFNEIQQNKQVPTRHRQSTSPYTSGTLRTSLTSLQSQNRIIGNLNNNTNHHRTIVDVERASRFLQSRRRVVKLLITLVIVFFITRLPSNIVSIYIDITSNTYIPDNSFTNGTKSGTVDNSLIDFLSHVANTDKKMTLVLYVNPILQLFSLSNSAINPLCYCVMSHAVKNLITLIRQKLRRRGQKKASAIPLTQRPIALNQSLKMLAHD
ncbi:hypothetical protein I4U23_020667 [Adineta vaga]|nr:hypothetical protein I4U23_020667 [Adineta vaga]